MILARYSKRVLYGLPTYHYVDTHLIDSALRCTGRSLDDTMEIIDDTEARIARALFERKIRICIRCIRVDLARGRVRRKLTDYRGDEA